MRPWEARARFSGRDMLCGEACEQREDVASWLGPKSGLLQG